MRSKNDCGNGGSVGVCCRIPPLTSFAKVAPLVISTSCICLSEESKYLD